MNTQSTDLSLTAEQLNRIVKCVSEEAEKTRVGAKFLPRVEVDPAAVGIPNLMFFGDVIPPPPGAAAGANQRLIVDSNPNLFLTIIQASVYLAAGELGDPSLAAVLSKFRRVANLIARAEDGLIFSGQALGPDGPIPAVTGLPAFAGVQTLAGGAPLSPDNGLLPSGFYPGYGAINFGARGNVPGSFAVAGVATPQNILPNVVNAITLLEGNGYVGPFACALSPTAYTVACMAILGMPDLPRDLVLRVLQGGPLVTSTMISNIVPSGVVVALGGEPTLLVVAKDITVDFLQINAEPRIVCRVSEKVALRPADFGAIVVLS